MIISLISFLGLVFGYYLTSIFKQELKDVEKFIAITMNIVIILLIISLVLVSNLSLIFIIAIITFSGARNSVMKGYDYWKDREELRQAQLNALRRGKVNVKLKGKMRTLK